MASKVGIAVIVGIAIIVGVIVIQLDSMSWEKSTTEEYYDSIGKASVAHVVYPENPQFLYGLKINKDKYVLGENIFVSITGIPMELKDEILFFTPKGVKYHEIEIDGSVATSGKEYFRPQLLRAKDLCQKEQLIGEWKVFFATNPGEALTFEITNEILPNNELYYEKCNETGQEMVVDPTRMELRPAVP